MVVVFQANATLQCAGIHTRFECEDISDLKEVSASRYDAGRFVAAVPQSMAYVVPETFFS